MLDNSLEYILCSAILRKEPKPTTLFNDIGKVELGFRHCDILQKFQTEVDRTPSAQGFLTSRGRFVSREEAKEIALKCGQITKTISSVLTSEDLY